MSSAAQKSDQISGQAPDSTPKRVIGRPFVPGVSGNPGGRPKDKLKALIAAETDNGMELLQKFLSISRGKDAGYGSRERMQALSWLAERYFGKVPDVSATIDLNDLEAFEGEPLTVEELKAIARTALASKGLPSGVVPLSSVAIPSDTDAKAAG